MEHVKIGVPQGCVLGPVLYMLFINELPELVNNPMCNDDIHHNHKQLFTKYCRTCGVIPSYADDATVVTSSRTRELNQVKLNANLDRIAQFLNNNKLSINKTKTTILEIMIKQKRQRVTGPAPELRTVDENREEKIITSGKSTCVLGCNFQDNLSWKEHIISGEKPLLTEARKKLGALKHLASQLPQNCRKLLANGLVIAKINYLISTWGGSTNNILRKVKALINNTARFVTKDGRQTSTKTLMDKCKWLDLQEKIRYFTATSL